MKLKILIMMVCAFPVICFSAKPQRFPTDVTKFVAQRQECDYLRGEIPDPSEKERLEQVIAEINSACRGTDTGLAALKRKYRQNVMVIKELNQFEPQIEPKRP